MARAEAGPALAASCSLNRILCVDAPPSYESYIGLLYVLGAWAIVHLSTLKFWWDLAKLNSPKVLESW